MARLVVHALEERQHALVEAGTGSGKSFAYLIPLIWQRQPGLCLHGQQDACRTSSGKRTCRP